MINKFMKFNSKYKQLTESLLIYDPTFLLTTYCKLTKDQFTVLPNKSVNIHTNITIPEELIQNGKLLIKFNKIDGDFYCYSNQLTSLLGAPTTTNGNFICYNNQLTSLQHAPTTINGDFYCYSNKLTSLQHAPTTINGDFICSHNQLTSLQHAPTTIGGFFICSNNQLTSLQHAPTTVDGDFSCSNNKIKFTVKNVKSISKVKGDIYV